MRLAVQNLRFRQFGQCRCHTAALGGKLFGVLPERVCVLQCEPRGAKAQAVHGAGRQEFGQFVHDERAADRVTRADAAQADAVERTQHHQVFRLASLGDEAVFGICGAGFVHHDNAFGAAGDFFKVGMGNRCAGGAVGVGKEKECRLLLFDGGEEGGQVRRKIIVQGNARVRHAAQFGCAAVHAGTRFEGKHSGTGLRGQPCEQPHEFFGAVGQNDVCVFGNGKRGTQSSLHFVFGGVRGAVERGFGQSVRPWPPHVFG